MITKNETGLIGLAPMGANLAQNFSNNQVKIAVFNRTSEKTEQLLDLKKENISGYFDLKEFVESLEMPRKIILLVKAGVSVDQTIEQLIPFLDPEDIIIDCGNSFWKDTIKRYEELKKININFVGCGISGGWQGALVGPSIMPGGSKSSIEKILPIMNKICAKDFKQNACITNVGLSGSGHFVKMVHNGIEYSIMQLIAEIYHFLILNGLENNEIAQVFEQINNSKNKSYLLDITVNILKYKLPNDKDELLNYIKPIAEAKGTGLWTIQSALEIGAYCNLLFAGLDARVASKFRNLNENTFVKTNAEKKSLCSAETTNILTELFHSVSKLIFIQGIELIKQYNQEYNWNVNLSETLRIWQGGCIIRTVILDELIFQIDNLFDTTSINQSLQTINNFNNIVLKNEFVFPSSVIDASKNYASTLVSDFLPQNLTQAQRDYFGSHTFIRSGINQTFTDKWGQ